MMPDEIDAQSGKAARCAICGDASTHAFRPFCSRRCANVDLARWLTGGYAIPVREDEDEDGGDAAADVATIRAEHTAGPRDND